jgi:hypothetical protein
MHNIMEAHFTWETKLFSRKFEIYRNDNMIGELRKECFSRKTYGELNVKKIIFVTKGFFKHETRIMDFDEISTLGTILYSAWKSKSTINYMNKDYKWQFDNFLRTKWSLGNENGTIIRYHSRGFKGIIDTYTEDEILILSGFFIRNYLKQRSAESAAASS